ncbi:hypothetical protein SDC9_104716 [bioreactor metagenome]|uniref:Uncharacterized protein n=1 Tax=bioreactor metagenome TaxID=1076179 RepID=A0A645AXQ4_9ZZZZ
MQRVDARVTLEPFTRQVVDGTVASRAVGQLIAFLAAKVDQIVVGLERRIRRHGQVVGVAGHQGDGREVLDRIELHAFLDVGNDGQRAAAADHQRIAVGRGLLHQIGCHRAAGTGLVVDDEALAELLRQLLGQHAGHDVGGAACGETDRDGDRFFRVACGRCQRGKAEGGCRSNAQQRASCDIHFCLLGSWIGSDRGAPGQSRIFSTPLASAQKSVRQEVSCPAFPAASAMRNTFLAVSHTGRATCVAAPALDASEMSL